MKDKPEKILASSSLLFGLTEEDIHRLLAEFPPEFKSFLKGEMAFSKGEKNKKIGFVTSGRCNVTTPASSAPPVKLRTLKPSDCFGLLSVFCPDVDFPTVITAAEPTEILFFEKEQVNGLIRNYPHIAQNTVYFLADRVSFLNRKLNLFCEPNAVRKLANYLLGEAERLNTDIFSFSATKICAETGIPRPSLYRAADSLENRGLICIKDRTVSVNTTSLLKMLGQ